MEASTDYEIKHAIVLTAEDVRKVWSVFQYESMSLSASIDCADGIERRYESIDDLLAFENSKRSEIKSLEIRAGREKYYSSSSISFGWRHDKPVKVRLSGEEQYVSRVRTKLADIADGTKPWYSWLASFDLLSYFWLPALSFSLALIYQLSPVTSAQEKSVSIVVLSMLIGTAIMAAIGAFVGLTLWLKKRYFPVCVYAIGQGERRHRDAEQFRWAVIVGFVVSIVGSIVMALL